MLHPETKVTLKVTLVIYFRFTGLCGGDAIFASEDATTETHLPSNDEQASSTVSVSAGFGSRQFPLENL